MLTWQRCASCSMTALPGQANCQLCILRNGNCRLRMHHAVHHSQASRRQSGEHCTDAVLYVLSLTCCLCSAAAERERVNEAADLMGKHWQDKMSLLRGEAAGAKAELRILASAHERLGAERAELAGRLVSHPAPLLPQNIMPHTPIDAPV